MAVALSLGISADVEGGTMAEEYWAELRYRPLDEKGDMIMGGTENAMQGLQAMEQVLKTRLRALCDLWWEDGGDEPPMLGMLGLPRTEDNRSQLELMLVECVEDTAGVLTVENVKSEYGRGRSFMFSCDVKTVYGATKAEVAL